MKGSQEYVGPQTFAPSGGGGGADAAGGIFTFTAATPLGPFIIPLSAAIAPLVVCAGEIRPTVGLLPVILTTVSLPVSFTVIAPSTNAVVFDITGFVAGAVLGTVTFTSFVGVDVARFSVMATS